jgi:hypothetical protein
MGLKVDVMSNFIGGPAAIDIASNVLREKPLPDDLTVKTVDQGSPGTRLESYAQVALPHGVLPPIGAVLRGISADQTAVGNGDPVCVAGEIGENSLRSAKRVFGLDDPFCFVQWGQIRIEGLWIGECCWLGVKLKLPGLLSSDK